MFITALSFCPACSFAKFCVVHWIVVFLYINKKNSNNICLTLFTVTFGGKRTFMNQSVTLTSFGDDRFMGDRHRFFRFVQRFFMVLLQIPSWKQNIILSTKPANVITTWNSDLNEINEIKTNVAEKNILLELNDIFVFFVWAHRKHYTFLFVVIALSLVLFAAVISLHNKHLCLFVFVPPILIIKWQAYID